MSPVSPMDPTLNQAPLKGVRILAVEQYGAGPFGTLYLGMMGAEVIKIENPGSQGDVSRTVGPHFHGESSLFFEGLNHNKKSLALDISTKDGRLLFGKLAAEADAVFTNLRGDVPRKLGLTYESLKEDNEKIVCAHLSGYGRDNSRRNHPGYDYIMQAETGYFSLTGETDAPPTRFGLSIVDLMAGVTLSLGLVSSLYQANVSGLGRDVDVSLFDVSLYNLNYVAMWFLNAEAEQERVDRSAHFSLTPCQLVKTADGWIYLMCNKEKFWENLCRSADIEQLLHDPRFRDFPSRLENRMALSDLLDKALSNRTTAQWIERFGSDVPASAVLNLREALENPFLSENNSLIECATNDNESMTYLRNPIRFAEEHVHVASAPTLGQHTSDILSSIGIGANEQISLREKGVIR